MLQTRAFYKTDVFVGNKWHANSSKHSLWRTINTWYKWVKQNNQVPLNTYLITTYTYFFITTIKWDRFKHLSVLSIQKSNIIIIHIKQVNQWTPYESQLLPVVTLSNSYKTHAYCNFTSPAVQSFTTTKAVLSNTLHLTLPRLLKPNDHLLFMSNKSSSC